MTDEGGKGVRVKVSGIVLPLEAGEQEAGRAAAERAGVSFESVNYVRILRRALDARGSRPPVSVYTVGLELAPGVVARGLAPWPEDPPEPVPIAAPPPLRPIVVGAGPGGLFAALRLSAWGLKPVIVERGRPVGERVRDAARYWKTGEVVPDSNVQFGEGGAGAFSDGKLTSRSKDPRKEWVLRRINEAGAHPAVLYEAKSHIGTSRVRSVVAALRERLLCAGAEYRFGERVTGLLLDGGRAVGVETTLGRIEGGPVFLAVGHSARDVYAFLADQGVALSAKGFAVGLRIEVSQTAINSDRFGRWASLPGMEAAEFAVARKSSSGRGVYSFCMCPGGVVIPAASEPDGLVINGMSGPLRSGKFANAALVAEVRPGDFGNDPFRGIGLQRDLEAMAQAMAGPRAVPAQSVASFLGGTQAVTGDSSCPWPLRDVILRGCLPGFAADAIAECLPSIVQEVRPLGDGTLMGVETRTSSPVRIDRDERMVSASTPGLYPVGEGAGYAGGIVSSAIDGVRAVDAWIESLRGIRS